MVRLIGGGVFVVGQRGKVEQGRRNDVSVLNADGAVLLPLKVTGVEGASGGGTGLPWAADIDDGQGPPVEGGGDVVLGRQIEVDLDVCVLVDCRRNPDEGRVVVLETAVRRHVILLVRRHDLLRDAAEARGWNHIASKWLVARTSI